MLEILYQDSQLVVCVKPAGVISQDGGENSMPALLKQQLNVSYIGVVHRLDREVGGVMVFALTERSAAEISRQIQNRSFRKAYLAALCGTPDQDNAVLEDLLFHDKNRNKTYVVDRRRNGVKEASLQYEVLQTSGDNSLVLVYLHTGRTHQIRVQFSSRKLPLLGDRKYGGPGGPMGLWSCSLEFFHPVTGKKLLFRQLPPAELPWSAFSCLDSI